MNPITRFFATRAKPVVKEMPNLSADEETAILALGTRMLAVARENPEVRGLKDQLADWAMADPGCKVQLFRFVDAFPRLRGSDEVYAHLKEYLSQPGVQMPKALAAMVSMGAMAKGVATGTIEKGITDLGRKFIAGDNATSAIPMLRKRWTESIGFTADLLGEACVSDEEARVYRERYRDLIVTLSDEVASWPANPELERDHLGPVPRANVSIKLSSLAGKYTPMDIPGSVERCLEQLAPLLIEAGKRGVMVNFDVEQSELKELNLAVFRRCCETFDFHAALAMQAYLRSGEDDARGVIAWAKAAGKQVTVRLVKGAYWDHEVVRAGEMLWPIPVWTDKADSDACFERMAKIFIDAMPRKPGEPGVKLAVGSHNLRSIAAVTILAQRAGFPKEAIEYQMLYGMGTGLKVAAKAEGLRLREYVPVGELVPGMAYLVRRLLENTSNQSWLLQGLSSDLPPSQLLASPHTSSRAKKIQPRASVHCPVVAGVDGGTPFVSEALRDFSQASQHTAFGEAIKSSVVAQIPITATAADATAAITIAHAAFPAWRDRDAVERAAIIAKAGAIMRARRDQMSAVTVRESGKVWAEADADVCEAIDFCMYYARQAPSLFAPTSLGNFPGELDESWYQARGVVAVISPWNFPVAICAGMTAAALVTGNTVIVKPAEQTPACARLMCEALWEAGVPAEVLRFLAGPGETAGAALVSDPRVTSIAFTGSREVGLSIWASAGRTAPEQMHLKRVICEMGGKNAIIIDGSADLDEAVHGVRHSAFAFAGQKCSACSRLIVVDSAYDDFVARLVASCQGLVVGDPTHPATDIGPVIDEEAATKIRSYIELARREGKLLLADQEPRGHVLGKPLIGPHIVAGLAPTHRLAQEEIFGPVLAIIRVATFREALEVANSVPFRLTGGVYSRTPSHLAAARRDFRVGNLYLNRACTGALVGRHPFGGFGMSGGGTKAGGADYLKNFVDPRCCAENTMRRGFAPGMDE